MVVELDNGMRFISNFRYNIKAAIDINDKTSLSKFRLEAKIFSTHNVIKLWLGQLC
jgi:hypothetical protein